MNKMLFKILGVPVFKDHIAIHIIHIDKSLHGIVSVDSFYSDVARFVVANVNREPILITVKFFEELKRYINGCVESIHTDKYEYDYVEKNNEFCYFWELKK